MLSCSLGNRPLGFVYLGLCIRPGCMTLVGSPLGCTVPGNSVTGIDYCIDLTEFGNSAVAAVVVAAAAPL